MKCYFLLVVCLQVVPLHSAPLLLLWQNQIMMQQQAQEEMRQQMQAISEWNNQNYPHTQKPNEPQIMLILSEAQLYKLLENAGNLKMGSDNSNQIAGTTVSNFGDENSDAVIIDAATASDGKASNTVTITPKKEKLLIGNLISAIPFLPIEINVPDTISWIYNGIASIIGNIGQRLPLYRPSAPVIAQENLRVLLQKLQAHNKNQAPILVLPDVAQMYPFQF